MGNRAGDPGLYRQRIEELLADEHAVERVERYLDPREPFAAFSFDTAGENPHNELTNDDVLALNFLSAPIGPMTYRCLMELRPRIASCLHKLSPQLHLWQLQSQAYEDANALWKLLMDVRNIGHVRASKLMARKRPNLMPILDKNVSAFFDGRTSSFWEPLGKTLQDAELRARIEIRLRPPGVDTSELSLLRILDIAIWMTVQERGVGRVEVPAELDEPETPV
ncbi:MAG TPA: DUF6308 family protein [Actinomycetota bacterium]|nr:DUF6308 family protein [Actinomycetota bacterium]